MTHNKDNGSLASTSKCVENDNDFKRLMLAKIGAIEDFLIKIDVKLDNLRQNNRTTNQKKSTNEIDIGLLKALGLPAESESDVEKLEENLKNDEFRLKLVCLFISFIQNLACFLFENKIECFLYKFCRRR